MFYKKGVLRNFANSQENTCAREACNFIEKETRAQVFSCEFCGTSFFTDHLWWLLLNQPIINFFSDMRIILYFYYVDCFCRFVCKSVSTLIFLLMNITYTRRYFFFCSVEFLIMYVGRELFI